jgi:hypothetical protein
MDSDKISSHFKKCMQLMKEKNHQTQEEGFHMLLPYANECIELLIEAFRKEQDFGLKCWLLELIGESKSPLSFPVLKEMLSSENERLQSWAVWGLENLDTKESRTELFRNGLKNKGEKKKEA